MTAAATAIKAVDRTTKTQVARALRGVGPEIWNGTAVSRLTRTAMDRAVFNGTRFKASSSSLTLEAATAPTIPVDPRAVEFGDPSKTFTTYKRQGHSVTRRTQEQLPGPIRKGRVVHPAFKAAIPRVMSLYVQTVVRSIQEALEGKK